MVHRLSSLLEKCRRTKNQNRMPNCFALVRQCCLSLSIAPCWSLVRQSMSKIYLTLFQISKINNLLNIACPNNFHRTIFSDTYYNNFDNYVACSLLTLAPDCEIGNKFCHVQTQLYRMSWPRPTVNWGLFCKIFKKPNIMPYFYCFCKKG